MNIYPIRTEEDHQRALKQVAPFFDNPPADDDPVWADVDVMVTLIDAYEREHFPIKDTASPIDCIKFRMEQQGLTVKDLVPFIGRTNRVYEILSGKRNLTLDMIRKLHEGLGIPLECLI